MSSQNQKESNVIVKWMCNIVIVLAIFIILCICFNFRLFTHYFGDLRQLSFFEFFRRLFMFIRDCILFMR